jgi:Flp pilus assembly protein TadD
MVRTRDLLAYDTQAIDLSVVVERGLRCCREGDWENGLKLLRKAARKDRKGGKLPSAFYSYLGYGSARFEGQRKDGLALCLHAIQVGREEPDNYLNLARLYLLTNDRRRAVAAIHRGLKLDSRHHPLLALRASLGYRRKPVIPFLSRESWINRFLGGRRHRRQLDKQGLT